MTLRGDRESTLSPALLRFSSDDLERSFWALPTVKRSLLYVDEWSIVPVVIINCLAFRAWPWALKEPSHSLMGTRVVLGLFSCGYLLLQLFQGIAIHINKESYYTRRRSWVTFQRVFRVFGLSYIAWTAGLATAWTEAPIPGLEMQRRIWALLLVGTGALYSCAYSFQFPVDFRTHVCLSIASLPAQLLLTLKLATVLALHGVRPSVCNFYRRIFQWGVLGLLPERLHQWVVVALTGHCSLAEACEARGPLALAFFFSLYFGFVFPTAACYVWEARIKAEMLRAHRHQQQQPDMWWRHVSGATVADGEAVRGADSAASDAVMSTSSTGSARFRTTLVSPLPDAAALRAAASPHLPPYWSFVSTFFWSPIALAVLFYALFIATGLVLLTGSALVTGVQ